MECWQIEIWMFSSLSKTGWKNCIQGRFDISLVTDVFFPTMWVIFTNSMSCKLEGKKMKNLVLTSQGVIFKDTKKLSIKGMYAVNSSNETHWLKLQTGVVDCWLRLRTCAPRVSGLSPVWFNVLCPWARCFYLNCLSPLRVSMGTCEVTCCWMQYVTVAPKRGFF